MPTLRRLPTALLAANVAWELVALHAVARAATLSEAGGA